MTRGLLLCTVGLALAAGLPARAAVAPRAGYEDPRIRTVVYDPEQVVSLSGHLGYQMLVEFGEGERIENVSIGDALGWQVTPNKRADLLFLKPLDKKAVTNMTVVTDRRRYAFELRAYAAPTTRSAHSPDMAYIVRFLYPQDVKAKPVVVAPPAPPPPPERRNTAYTYTGSRAALPSVVFDDGRFTYFQWPEGVSTPALFVLGKDDAESIVNSGVRDGFLVVEQLAPRFVLRNGRDVTYVINEGYSPPLPGALAPRPHDAKTAKAAAKEGVIVSPPAKGNGR